MYSSNPRATSPERRVLVPTRYSNRLAGKIADPTPLISNKKSNKASEKNSGPTQRKLQRIPGSYEHPGRGDEEPLSEPSMCNPKIFGEDIRNVLNPSFDRRVECFRDKGGYASEQGSNSLHKSVRDKFSPTTKSRAPSSSFHVLPTSSFRSNQKDEQKGVQELHLRRNVQNEQTTPVHVAIPGWAKKESVPEIQSQQSELKTDFVSREFVVNTLKDLFYQIENVIDNNTVKTENKIIEQFKHFKDLAKNQSIAIDLIGDVTAEIQQYFSTEIEPLNEHFKTLSSTLQEEVKTLSFKGKEIKTIEQKINDITFNLDELKKEQKLLADKFDVFINSHQTTLTRPTHISPKKESPSEDKPNLRDTSISIEIDKEIRQQMLASIPKTSEWPTFSGEGEYDHTGFIEWIDTLKTDIDLHDRIIVSRLNLVLKDSANEWYKGLKKEFGLQDWEWWKRQINIKFGNATWRRRIQKAFYTSRFDANSTPIAAWVTKQYKRIKAIEPYLTNEQINIKLLDLCDGEVAYAVKSALDTTNADISMLINVLQELVDQTSIGKKPKVRTVMSNNSEKHKTPSNDIKCNHCGYKGHLAKDCRKKKSMNAITEEESTKSEGPVESSEDESDKETVGNIFDIMEDSISNINEDNKLTYPNNNVELKGKSCIMSMQLDNLNVNCLLDSGAHISCVGLKYLSIIDKDYLHKMTAPDNKIYKSCNNKLNYIGKIFYTLEKDGIKLPIIFLIMKDIKAKYFIIGNNYLHHHKISMMNDDIRYVTIGNNNIKYYYLRNNESSVQAIQSFRDQIKEEAKINDTLNSDQTNNLLNLLVENKLAFSTQDEDFTAIKGHELSLELTITKPYPPILRRAPYPASPRSREAIKEHIDNLLKMKIIRKVPPGEEVNMTTPVVIAWHNEKSRLCGDFRALNSVTVPIRYPMPKINESLTNLAKAKYITTMDVLKGFHQNVVHKDSRQYLRIICYLGVYEYLRMPFGIKNAPSHFQRMMDTEFYDELREGWLIIYIDDIIIFSQDFDEHLSRLDMVLKKAIKMNMKISLPKCNFCFNELKALGHVVSGLTLGIDQNRVAAVLLKPIPSNLKELQSFLGFMSYYRGHIKDYAQYSSHLTKLLSPNTVFEMTKERIEAYNFLKNA